RHLWLLARVAPAVAPKGPRVGVLRQTMPALPACTVGQCRYNGATGRATAETVGGLRMRVAARGRAREAAMNYRKAEAKAAARAQFRGLWAAITTPFTADGELDESGLRRNMRQLTDVLHVDG